MSNPYYSNTGYPQFRAPGKSEDMRAELKRVEGGMERLPDPIMPNQPVFGNPSGTGMMMKDKESAKALLDLDKVDNTSDADKPISTKTAAALATKAGAAETAAALETKADKDEIAAALETKADKDEIAANLPNVTTAGADKIVVTNSTGDGWDYTAITAAGKALLDDASAATQRVTLGLGSVDNTADVDKPISTLAQAALNLKADESLFAGASGHGFGYRYINGTLVQAATSVSNTSTPSITFPVAFPNSVTCIVFAVADLEPGDLRINMPTSDLTKVGFLRTRSEPIRINIIAWGY